MMDFNVYIGWDSREDIAYQLLRHSILRKTPNVKVFPIKQYELRSASVYTRPEDKKGSTEFTLTRFLVPYLNNYSGYSLFLDCDMLMLDDVTKILEEADLNKAVSCVKHDYEKIGKNLTKTKMDGASQEIYPRKNWSSVMLFNNKLCKALTPEAVNNQEPSWLHRMNWTTDDQIGELHHRWNYLAGYYNDNDYINIHYTDGLPFMKNEEQNYHNTDLAEHWYNELIHWSGMNKNETYKRELNG